MPSTKLIVNEKEIPLNDMMETMLHNLIMGYIKSAKGIPEDMKTIEVKIDL